MRKECKVKVCDRLADCKGYCGKHWFQVKRHGRVQQRTMYDKNDYVEKDGYTLIILRNREQKIVCRAIIDNDKVNFCKQYKWGVSDCGGKKFTYASTRLKGKIYLLHRMLLNIEDRKIVIDHINHDCLDNRICNIRAGSQAQNLANRFSLRMVKNRCGNWYVKITVNKLRISLGTYKNKNDAIIARNEAEIKYLKEFAPKR